MSGFSKYLQWENLISGWCPACGSTMSEETNIYICHNHDKNPFIVPRAKFDKIVRDIQDSAEYKFRVIRGETEPPPREVEI